MCMHASKRATPLLGAVNSLYLYYLTLEKEHKAAVMLTFDTKIASAGTWKAPGFKQDVKPPLLYLQQRRIYTDAACCTESYSRQYLEIKQL